MAFGQKNINKADYWVSNERKFCDFCKCWIADNKPSISFHENGKRHKENVAKRLDEISKQSAKDERSQHKVDQQMREMEEAAMRAYAGDVSRGADMTSRAIAAFNEASGFGAAAPPRSSTSSTARGGAASAASSGPAGQIGPQMAPSGGADDAEDEAYRRAGAVRTNGCVPGPAALPRRAIDPMMPPQDVLDAEERERRERMRRRGIVPADERADGREGGPVPENSMWVEAKSGEGHTYYWNVKSNATVWEEPVEGYMTLREYERVNEVALQQQAVKQQQEAEFMQGNADEIVAKYAREKLKARRAKPTAEEVKDKEEEQSNYAPFVDVETEARPLGQWQTVPAVEPVIAEPVDLQLPAVQHEFVYVPAANVEPEPPVKKFKEKVVTTLATPDEAGVSQEFRKRKGAAARRGNMRQRVDDD